MEKHEREVNDLHASYKAKLAETQDAMKTMKGNLEIMEDTMDNISKEKEREK